MELWTSLNREPFYCLRRNELVGKKMPKLLDILLQRNDTSVPWGFHTRGGLDSGTYPVISSVTFGTLASQHLNAGDKILEIEKQKANSLLQTEIERIIDNESPKLHLLVEKLPAGVERIRNQIVTNGLTPVPKKEFKETVSEHECIREKENVGRGVKRSTKIRLRETNRSPSLGGYDLQVNFERTKYREKSEPWSDWRNDSDWSESQKRLEDMSENFNKVFKEKIGEWMDMNMLGVNGFLGRQQSGGAPAGDGSPGVQPPPPPPPSFPGTLPGRRIKSEIPERGLEPPSVIQNAMMTKDKKPFTYTPGGIDLSEIRSPKMQRRINRNACAEEMTGMPAPTTNQPPVSPPANTNFAAMQSQLPAQVLPGGVPPPPPPPPSGGPPPPPPAPTAAAPPAAAASAPKPNAGRPPLGFDPNELLARVNKTPAYEPQPRPHAAYDPPSRPQAYDPPPRPQVYEPPPREEPVRNFKPQVEEKPKLQQKPNEVRQNVTIQNEPGHIYVPHVTPKTQNETQAPPATNHSNRGQLGSIYVPPVATLQEQSTPSPTSPFGYRPQQSAPSPAVDTKPQAPWVTVQRTPQSTAPWAKNEPESPKPAGARIIPIQIEGRDSPKPATPSPQPQATPPPFLQSPHLRQQQAQQQQQQQQQQVRQPPAQQQMRQQPQQQSQPQSNTRVIPIQIEGSSQPVGNQQPRSPGQGYNQSKFNPMTPTSPTPFSPSQEKDQRPQWAPVQPRQFKKEPEVGQQRPQQVNQQPQPEYGTYNTAGVPLSQLRKMQLSDDDRALMDKFKSQVEKQGNDILSDENTNPRYRGGYIPSRVFKMLDESVDDETYLHNESDPRYRGAYIPSKAFRMLQSMTDTAGDMPQQVPRSQSRGPTSRPVSGAQFQQDAQQGPYVPPSEQQAQEPRKYTGGSIPSRSFRMLQAMTGQEVSAPNPSGSTSGRETPVSGINRWCPSPSPSPIDPFWGYYPPDPYFMYNYISDLNAAYGFPPPPPPAYSQPPPFYPYPYMYPNYSSDNDEQGYSSTDELAQYYTNYRRNFGYSPFQPDRYTPNSFKVPRVCVTPVPGTKKVDQFQKINKVTKRNDLESVKNVEVPIRNEKLLDEQVSNEDDQTSSDEDSESDTEVEEDEEGVEQQPPDGRKSSLQTLKSVSNVNVYSSESTSTLVQEEIEVEEEEEEISSVESVEEVEQEEPVPHQLSVIFEESEHSDVESIKRMEQNRISESESCSTLDNGDDDSDNEELDVESSVTVRLPLKLQFSREDNEEVTTVIVGDSEIQRETLYDLNPNKETGKEEEKEEEEEEEDEDSYESDADVSVTFTVPTRSNSVISIDTDTKNLSNKTPEPIQEEVETEVTVCVQLSRSSVPKEEVKAVTEIKTETEDDSSSTSLQSNDTVLKQKEDTDKEESQEEEEDEKEEEEKPKTFRSWIDEEYSKDCKETDKTVVEETKVEESISYKEGVGKLEEMISSILETTKDTMSSSMELSQKDLEPLRKKDSVEESEEDDSGVTSDMSIKQFNSETDADTESDYCELSKMTKFQRASTHSRLFKLLQEECERNENEDEEEDSSTAEPQPSTSTDTLTSRKQKLTLPLNQAAEVDSLSSSSGIASPSSPTISDRLVKELIHSLLNKKKGKRFRKLPLAKLHAAALRILQEEMDPYDTSPTSGEDSLFLSPIQKKKLHSKLTAMTDSECLEPVPESIYGENYYDYLDYYNTWGNPELYYPEDYDIVPSRAFRMLREQTCSPKPIEGFKARCPRVASKKNIQEPMTGRKTPVVSNQEPEIDPHQNMSFAEKQEKVSKVLEKSVKS